MTAPAFWRGRRVLVTGHTGFKGSWLSLWLQGLGADVTGLALAPPTSPSLFALARVGDGMTSVEGDIRDIATVRSVMAECAPEVVFHLAAQPLVLESYRDPVASYATNVMGTVHVLDAVRATPGVRAVVNVTTDKCYANREWTWGYREVDRLGGDDPYSSSKACAELVAAAMRASYFPAARYAEHGVSLASVRAGNVIGGGDWAANRLVPDLLAAFAAGRPAVLRRPDAIRPWQHVLDPLAGYLALAERLVQDGPSWGEAWNFGPADHGAQPVRWVADRLSGAWGPTACWTIDDAGSSASTTIAGNAAGASPHETHVLTLDSAKARQRLRWMPRLDLDAAIRWTADWHRAYVRRDDMRDVTRAQLHAYGALPAMIPSNAVSCP
ncbi:MAG: CDP-glucose 4,6-dehydratase [Gemmatimonadota bacterium]